MLFDNSVMAAMEIDNVREPIRSETRKYAFPDMAHSLPGFKSALSEGMDPGQHKKIAALEKRINK